MNTADRTSPAHTVADAIKIACSSRTAFYAALKAGHIKAKKIGRKTIITDAALTAYLDGLPDYKPTSRAA
jgi:hypothetical protein